MKKLLHGLNLKTTQILRIREYIIKIGEGDITQRIRSYVSVIFVWYRTVDIANVEVLDGSVCDFFFYITVIFFSFHRTSQGIMHRKIYLDFFF